jgi:hypothetical protein
MFGNKYHGDELAKEFYKLVTLKKVASDSSEEKAESLAADLQNHAEDAAVDPAQFLNTLDAAPEIAEQLDSEVSDLDSWAADGSQVESQDDCGDIPMYSDDTSYLLDQRASVVLNGLGKIAGSLKQRGENFAADIVEATALSIREDMVKEASQKLETITILSKIASDISEDGDQFTADIVKATISKIKGQNS